MTITECKYYRDKDKECDVWGIPCSMKKDCYYKQLKRLEQENNLLKQTLKDKNFVAIVEENGKLEQENENLKQQLEIDKNQINYFIEENERLKETEKEISDFISDISTCGFRYDYRSPDNLDELQQCIEDLCNKFDNYEHTLREIKEIAEEGLQSICYKANCATCRCYSKKISNDTLENILNDYFDEDGDFIDTEGDFFEVLQAFIDRERVACNKAQPISEKILDLITKAEEE